MDTRHDYWPQLGKLNEPQGSRSSKDSEHIDFWTRLLYATQLLENPPSPKQPGKLREPQGKRNIFMPDYPMLCPVGCGLSTGCRRSIPGSRRTARKQRNADLELAQRDPLSIRTQGISRAGAQRNKNMTTQSYTSCLAYSEAPGAQGDPKSPWERKETNQTAA